MRREAESTGDRKRRRAPEPPQPFPAFCEAVRDLLDSARAWDDLIWERAVEAVQDGRQREDQ